MSEDGDAVQEEAEKLIIQTWGALKPRHRKNGIRVTKAIAESEPLRAAYQDALDKGDKDRAEGLADAAAGFIHRHMEKGLNWSTAIVATLLASREKDKFWCQAILDVMTNMGVIGPNH